MSMVLNGVPIEKSGVSRKRTEMFSFNLHVTPSKNIGSQARYSTFRNRCARFGKGKTPWCIGSFDDCPAEAGPFLFHL